MLVLLLLLLQAALDFMASALQKIKTSLDKVPDVDLAKWVDMLGMPKGSTGADLLKGLTGGMKGTYDMAGFMDAMDK